MDRVNVTRHELPQVVIEEKHGDGAGLSWTTEFKNMTDEILGFTSCCEFVGDLISLWNTCEQTLSEMFVA